MPDRRRTFCRVCGKHTDVCGPISWRGKCLDCATALSSETIESLVAHKGEPFRNYRRAVAASVGAVLLEDLKQRS